MTGGMILQIQLSNHRNKLHLKIYLNKNILNCKNISKFYCFAVLWIK